MKKSIRPHIELILAALRSIEQYQPEDRAAFLEHPMAQDAILMRLQEIGENLARIRRIDEEAFTAAADDSWVQIIGLRNIISHGYHQIDPEKIWQILTEELSDFTATIEAFADDV